MLTWRKRRRSWRTVTFFSWRFFFFFFTPPLTFSSPWCLLAIIINDGKCWQIAFYLPISPPTPPPPPPPPNPFAFVPPQYPVLPHSSFVVVPPLSPWGEVTPCLLVVSAALHCTRGGGGDLDSQSIFPLQLSQQTPKVVSRLFSRSDINLALPFYIKNACIVGER